MRFLENQFDLIKGISGLEVELGGSRGPPTVNTGHQFLKDPGGTHVPEWAMKEIGCIIVNMLEVCTL